MANPQRKKFNDVGVNEPFWYEVPGWGRKKLVKVGDGTIRGYISFLNPLEKGELEIPPDTEVEMVEV